MWPSPSANLYLRISRTRRIFSLSAGIAFLPLSATERSNVSPTGHPDKHPNQGRHHLGIRGRLILGIGGRHHFGIRGRHASEFALGVLAARSATGSRCRILRKNPYDAELVVGKDYVEIDVID
ncbi:hypothetical protein E0H71_27095 [Rhizobium leguminosarum bv. viciae]|nr:hypothetical protein E0H72_34110 [Rhizobium leguminosarum bv. viciae]TCA49238.1 hypothetical protein E0H71_27095 [Rhizobium leguminosarum bv. viciae]